MVEFTLAEEKIIRCLHEYGFPMSTNDIAKRTGLGWATVKKYTEKLFQMDILIAYEDDDVTFWELDWE